MEQDRTSWTARQAHTTQLTHPADILSCVPRAGVGVGRCQVLLAPLQTLPALHTQGCYKARKGSLEIRSSSLPDLQLPGKEVASPPTDLCWVECPMSPLEDSGILTGETGGLEQV